jgi:hypothetical protein
MERVVCVIGFVKGTHPGNVQLPMEAGSHSVEISIRSKVSEVRGVQFGLRVLHSLSARKAMELVVE